MRACVRVCVRVCVCVCVLSAAFYGLDQARASIWCVWLVQNVLLVHRPVSILSSLPVMAAAVLLLCRGIGPVLVQPRSGSKQQLLSHV
jgi:hypothetical protein